MIKLIKRILGLGKPSRPSSPPWDHKYDELARYNTTVGWGVQHDEATKTKMRILQADYDRMMQEWYESQNGG